ncbi:MAG: ATP-binding protein [Verrucomicrobia bacterium]|nr:ATP-binding protein [Verrucomicrobiota bacterium]
MTKGAAKTHYELFMPGEAKSLASVRWIIGNLAEKLGLTEEAANQVTLAVDEACSNVFEHSYGKLVTKPPVHIEISAENGQIIVDITDQGKGFDLESHRTPKFPDHWQQGHERGAGIYLIKQCVDELQYDHLPDNRNRLRLIKKVTPQMRVQTAADTADSHEE